MKNKIQFWGRLSLVGSRGNEWCLRRETVYPYYSLVGGRQREKLQVSIEEEESVNEEKIN